MEEEMTVLEQLPDTSEVSGLRKKKRNPLWLVLLLLILVASGVGFYYLQMNRNQPEPTRLQREKDSIMGVLPGKSDAEVNDILNTVVEEGMVNISINQMPIFYDGGKRGSLGIQNIPGNHYSYQVELTIDSSGEMLYRSNLVQPGYYLDEVSLNRTLDAGSYGAKAVFTVYSIEDDEDVEIAQINADLMITVFE